jgi:hypothetical protein
LTTVSKGDIKNTKKQSTWAHAEPAGSEGKGRTAANTSICGEKIKRIKYQDVKTKVLVL